jgi:hypothetical protein
MELWVMMTTTPSIPPPNLFCPICSLPLVYRETVFNGVQPPERWDYFDCLTCGTFEYRQRTRKTRQVPELPFPLARGA